MTPFSLILTVIGGLILAGLLAWIRRPQLTVLVPRTFSYSQITDRGQLVELSVINRGFNTEEAIDVVLSPHMKYEVLGANTPDVALSGNVVRIGRIGPSDESTFLLLVEGGQFKPDDITQTVSKETKGRTVSTLAAVPPTGPQRVALVCFFIAIPLTLYALPTALEFLAERTPLLAVLDSLDAKPKAEELNGWNVPSYVRKTSSTLFRDFAAGSLKASIGSPKRQAERLLVPVDISNGTAKIIKASASMTTAGSETKIPSYERHTGDIVVLPGNSEQRVIAVIVPERPSNPAERIVFIELSLKSTDGDTLSLSREYVARLD